MIEWEIEGLKFGTCNCDYSCPCQFEALPSNGDCFGFDLLEIDKGHFGDVDLAGTRAIMVFSWPGPIYQGQGELQLVIDTRTSAEQREALEQILTGQHTIEGATHWWVFRAMSDTLHPTKFFSIESKLDMLARKAQVTVGDLIDASCEPIRSPVSGEPHQIRIQIPEGIEFETAEIGSASANINLMIARQLNGTYGQFNRIRHNNKGRIR